MKITRYFQSCLLVEEGGVRILIDPSGQEKDRLDEFGKLDAVFYTHEHGDHFDANMAETFVEQAVAPVYANESTARLVKASVNIVKDGQELDIIGIKVKAIELTHCLMPDGSEGPQNIGYLVNGRLFHAGDGKELAAKSVELLAMPITGPDVSIKDGFSFARQMSAEIVIPIHYDFIGMKPEVFKSFAENYKQPFKVHSIGIGETAEF